MCGIYVVISKRKVLDETDQLHIDLVERRGPDRLNRVTVDLENGYFMHLVSSVLHLRGHPVAMQPFELGGNILQWNGEIFGGLDVPESESDTKVLAEKLRHCETDSDICDIIKTIEGPWAFVYFQKSKKHLWFGRDYIGRRSLLYFQNETELFLTSVARRVKPWNQVPAHGIFKIDLCEPGEVLCYPWKSVTRPQLKKIDAILADDKNSTKSVMVCSTSDIFDPICPPIAKFNPQSHHVFPDFDKSLSNRDILRCLLRNDDYSGFVQALLQKLRLSVKKRVKNIPKKLGNSASLGVLFSGGIDSTIIALIADEFIDSDEDIVLLNVAFETQRSNENFNVPDRITGRAALKELQTLRPNRTWDFKEINVSLKELKNARNDVIADLTHPLVTVLDDSIGCALWFAARGDLENPISDTKVVLSGLGADEQLGGYSRHRSAFENHGLDAFEREIMLEIERLSTRNLGRDDRIVSHNGKEVRFPYLDENVISFLNETPTNLKAHFSLKRGIGEKILLRTLGFQLGLRETAFFPKRAIQFGSRIAKAECRKEKASDVCERLF